MASFFSAHGCLFSPALPSQGQEGLKNSSSAFSNPFILYCYACSFTSKIKQLGLFTSKFFHTFLHLGHLFLKSSNSLRQYLKGKKTNIIQVTDEFAPPTLQFFFFKSTMPSRLKSSSWIMHVCQRSSEACTNVPDNSEFSKASMHIKVTVSYCTWCMQSNIIKPCCPFIHRTKSSTFKLQKESICCQESSLTGCFSGSRPMIYVTVKCH